MCDPVTAAIAVAAVSTITAGAGMIAQAKTANAQEEAIRAQHVRVSEENRQQASTEIFDQTREARKQQALIRTSAGEAGLSLSSGSIEGLLNDSAAQLEFAQGRSLANMESRNAAANEDAASMLSQIQKPTLLGAGLQLAGTAASAYASVGNAKIYKQMASTPKVGA